MLKRIFNECKFNLSIITEGPLLVKSGYANVQGPDMTPVRTYRDGKYEVFIPGSSLKGVFRSYIEKVIRTLNEGVVCNPFVKKADVNSKYSEVFCGEKFHMRQKQKEELSTEQIYSDSCPVCRLFGSTYFIGRIAIGDAYLEEGQKERTEERDGVGIDRFTGGSFGGAKFELEVVSAGTIFETDIYLRNFETWQLGMIILVVKDLEDGLIRIGSGTSRGLGAVKGNVDEMTISYIGLAKDKPQNEVWGIGKFLGDGSYGTELNDFFAVEELPSEEIKGIRKVATYKSNCIENLKQKAITNFISKIQCWQISEKMQFEQTGG